MAERRANYSILTQVSSEYLGSLFLVMAAISPIILFNRVLNSGIALAVLADALAVGTVLFVLIEIFGPVCGAHFNPAVTLAMAICGTMGWRRAALYILTQIIGGLTGMIFSHLMFYHEIPRLVAISEVSRTGGSYFAEVLGTFILILTILFLIQNQSEKISMVVGLLVGGQLIATSSTMFANPQVTLARMLTHSAAGVKPIDGVVFIVMQVIGAVLAVLVFRTVYRTRFLINP